MRILVLIFALLSAPAFAADHSPSSSQAGERLAQAATHACAALGAAGGCNGCIATCPLSQTPTCTNAVSTQTGTGYVCQPAQCSCR